jgi:glycosyltransferase involved in cell wall biosynthesis
VVSATDVNLTVVVMAYNEAESLEPAVREIAASLARLQGPCEILIVDDGSTDGTTAIADRLAGELSAVRVIVHGVNGGLGAVYRTGFTQARGDLVTFFPADGQFPATIIEDFLPRMAGLDMVLGYLPHRHDSLPGRLLSNGEKLLYRLLFGRLPRFQGVFMFRRRLLEGLHLRSTGRGWGVLMEFLIRCVRRGARTESVPTELRVRRAGVSKVQNSRTIWSNLRQVMILRREMKD